MSLTISHSIMNNINLYHVFFVMANIRMLVDAIHYAVERLGFTEIKSLQLEVVLAIATGQDVFGVLPTGYGKSLCYACLPILFDQLRKAQEEQHSIVIVVSPLTAIIEDQVWQLKAI